MHTSPTTRRAIFTSDGVSLSPYLPHRWFLCAVVAAPFLAYMSHRGIIAYGPLIAAAILMLLSEVLVQRSMKGKDWIAVMAFLPYVAIAGAYYIRNPYQGEYLGPILLAILTLPLIVLAVMRLRAYDTKLDYKAFITRLIAVLLLAELFICLGQMSLYLYGVGLPIANEEYTHHFMVSGTAFNSNNLAAVVLLISFIYTRVEDYSSRLGVIVIWSMILALLLITASRSALVITGLVFILTRQMKPATIIYIIIAGVVIVIGYNFLFSGQESNIAARMSTRIASLISIFDNGLYSDHSMSLRVHSYLYFLGKLPDLGLGTGTLKDYFAYAGNANFPTWLMFRQPHSLIVELGYWLGLPGFMAFFGAVFYLLRYSKRILLLGIVLATAASIPSSVLQNILFSCFAIIAILSERHGNDKTAFTSQGRQPTRRPKCHNRPDPTGMRSRYAYQSSLPPMIPWSMSHVPGR